MPTINLETSRKIFELVGEYETEKSWHWRDGDLTDSWVDDWEDLSNELELHIEQLPAPDFGELIRVLPKIEEEKKDWGLKALKPNAYEYGRVLLGLYMHADSPEAGMIACDEYLAKLLV